MRSSGPMSRSECVRAFIENSGLALVSVGGFILRRLRGSCDFGFPTALRISFFPISWRFPSAAPPKQNPRGKAALARPNISPLVPATVCSWRRRVQLLRDLSNETRDGCFAPRVIWAASPPRSSRPSPSRVLLPLARQQAPPPPESQLLSMKPARRQRQSRSPTIRRLLHHPHPSWCHSPLRRSRLRCTRRRRT